jgi:hypothetical protein
VDFADHKPPLVFAYYAAAQLLGDGMLPVRLLTALLVVPLVAFCASAFFGLDRRDAAARVIGRLALLAGGGLLPPLAAWAVFAGLGAGDAFVYWNWTHSPLHWDWLLDDLGRRRPTYVLDTAAARLGRWGVPLEGQRRLVAFVAASYEPLDVVDHVRIYRRRGCPAP